jgi:hypothetical protein
MRYMRSYFWVYSRYFPSEITFKENYKLVIKELRNLGRKQILNRLKTIQDGAYAPTDLLTISLKESGNIFSLNWNKIIGKIFYIYIYSVKSCF